MNFLDILVDRIKPSSFAVSRNLPKQTKKAKVPHFEIIGMAALPFLCNGTSLIQGNLPMAVQSAKNKATSTPKKLEF